MQVTLISQPFPDGYDLSQLLDRLADDDSITDVVVVVAWAKRSGFRQVDRALARLRVRGVHITMIVGISEGGATRQGLLRAMELADSAFVYHVSGRTFHPKMYLGLGTNSFIALVGSHNLTRGGAVENFELGVVLEGYTSDTSDAKFLAQIRRYIDTLIGDSDVCLVLDERTFDRIVAKYPIGDEDERTSRRDTPPSIDDSDAELEHPLFGRSRHSLRTGRALSESFEPQSRGSRAGAGLPGGSEPHAGEPRGGEDEESNSKTAPQNPYVERRWIKVLKASDAQRLGGNSKPTGTSPLSVPETRSPM
jgi:hypothetical protein